LLPAWASTDALAEERPSEDPAIIAQWNGLAMSTILADATKKTPETILYLAFVQAAVYDAVVGIDGRYQPYLLHRRAPHSSSAQAAAVAAAHQVLLTYFPYATAKLDAAYRDSIAEIADGKAKSRGIAFGTLAANTLIQARRNDGRDAPIFFTLPPEPGVWRPTQPTFTPMLDPWLGAVTPLLARSASQFEPPRPPTLTSDVYTRDVAEVKAFGSATSTARTAAQTDTAIFFSGSPLVQFNVALQDQMVRRHMDLAAAARMFAAATMTGADGIITVWRAKLLYGLWRPITAINLADTDGNPATIADQTWVPLVTTPAYPEYPSGYNVVTAAFTGSLNRLFGTDNLDLTLTSTASPAVRHYDTGSAVRADVVDARVWLGFHFRTADIASRDLALRLTSWALGHYFQPTHDQE
jgi:hypothetical protein